MEVSAADKSIIFKEKGFEKDVYNRYETESAVNDFSSDEAFA